MRIHTASDKVSLKPYLLRLASILKQSSLGKEKSSYDFVKSSVLELRNLKRTTLPELQFSCFKAAIPHLYAKGDYSNALIISREMVSIAEMIGKKEWERIGNSYLGAVHRALGNSTESLVHFCRALQIAIDLEDRAARAIVLGNMATTLTDCGLFTDAIRCLEAAVILSDIPGRNFDSAATASKATAFNNLCHVYIRLNEYQRAYSYIVQSLALSPEPATSMQALSQVMRETNFVRVALELGKNNEAQRHAEICATYARINGSLYARLMNMAVRGALLVRHNDVSSGLLLMEQALEHAQQSNFVDSKTDVLTWLVKEYERLNRPADALRCLRSLMQDLIARRDDALGSLLPSHGAGSAHCEQMVDLHPLCLKEAELRAAAAEERLFVDQFEVLDRLAIGAGLREDPTGQHGYRVGRLSALFAERLGWPRDSCYAIDLAARLHDIGKVVIPDGILLSSDHLKEAERHFVQSHTTMGAELLSKSSHPGMELAADIARCHHEHWDGSGYPRKLSGGRIPLAARVVALTDVFDAITHGRPYAVAWPTEAALDHIASQSGKQFDPALCEAFIPLVRELMRKHPDLDEYLGRAAQASPFFTARRNLQTMLNTERNALGRSAFRG